MKVKWSKGKDDFRDAQYIRRKVFIEEQNVPLKIEMDEFDDKAYHIVVYNNDKPVAVGRLLEKEDYYLIGRIAVLKEYRGENYGRIIMENILKKAAELKANELQLHAQLTAKGFYEKLGFESFGEIFDEANIDHICMRKQL